VPETPERLAERLTSESQKTLEFFRALLPEQWDYIAYPQDPVWTIRHLLAHFVSVEQALKSLIEDVYAGGAGAPEGFDIDGFNADEVAKWVRHPPEELLLEFDRSRRAFVALVSRMQAADLAIKGRHPFLGWVTLKDMIKMLYRHDQIHLRDLRRLLKPEAGE
jgi:hypothetical protein